MFIFCKVDFCFPPRLTFNATGGRFGEEEEKKEKRRKHRWGSGTTPAPGDHTLTGRLSCWLSLL